MTAAPTTTSATTVSALPELPVFTVGLRDLTVPRPLDMPVRLSPSTAAAAGLEPVLGVSGSTELAGGDPNQLDLREAKIIAAPDDPADWPRWREQLRSWRALLAVGRDTATPGAPRPQEWAARCRSVFMAWLWDVRLYDFETDTFTPAKLLDELTSEFGGVDAVVLWHAYPIIGVDDRNQFDFYDIPGLTQVVQWFHDQRIRVF